jgi:hypothetical protein
MAIPFAKIIERDGYVVKSAKAKISIELLKGCKVFVISVPTSKGNQSAYTNGEIRILKDWVMAGGSLLLITDHMPDPPAIAELAEAFGITVNNGYVLNEDPNESKGPVFFRRNDGTLADHPITNGREGFDERIGSVTSFTGCAFKASVDFKPLLIFGPHKTSWMTKEPGKFPDDTPKIDVEGWYQGGVQECANCQGECTVSIECLPLVVGNSLKIRITSKNICRGFLIFISQALPPPPAAHGTGGNCIGCPPHYPFPSSRYIHSSSANREFL